MKQKKLPKKKIKKVKKSRCPICGREIKVNQYDAEIEITALHFKFKAIRDFYFCRNCGIGFAPMDKMFNLYEQHNITIGMAEEMAYSAQDRLSFEKAATNIKRYLNVEVGESASSGVFKGRIDNKFTTPGNYDKINLTNKEGF